MKTKIACTNRTHVHLPTEAFPRLLLLPVAKKNINRGRARFARRNGTATASQSSSELRSANHVSLSANEISGTDSGNASRPSLNANLQRPWHENCCPTLVTKSVSIRHKQLGRARVQLCLIRRKEAAKIFGYALHCAPFLHPAQRLNQTRRDEEGERGGEQKIKKAKNRVEINCSVKGI